MLRLATVPFELPATFLIECRFIAGIEMKGVFQTKVSPAYDDVPEERYHFPTSYLNQVQRTVGDWIVYYEPRRATADILRNL